MEENEKLEEFDLKDLMDEFSSSDDQSPEKAPGPPVEEDPVPEAPAEQEDREQPVTEETVRIDRIPEATVSEEETVQLPVEEVLAADKADKDTKAAMDGETVRFERIGDVRGEVRNAQPLEDEETELPETTEEETAAYSEQWEPEYEQPMGEYVPPNPIPFKPRSRLQEIKKKLVEGPERLYYEMSERGLTKLHFAIFLSVLLVLGSALVTTLYAMNKIPEHRLRLVVFTQFWFLLVAGLLGCYQMLEGIGDIFRGKFTLNSMLFFSFALCCADGIFGLKELRVSCCAAFSLQVTMSLWSSAQKRNVRMGQLDTMRKATRLDSITAAGDYYEDQKGLLRGEGQVEHFMDTLDDTCGPEKGLRIYALVAMVLCIGAGVAAGLLYNIGTGVQVAAVTTLTALPASVFVVVSRPMAILERRYHKLGTVICGWQGVKGMSGKAVFPLDHNDLFPAGSVKMNGVKFFGDRQPDELVAYAAAMVSQDGGALEPLFTELLESRNGRHYTVTDFVSYPEGGIGGTIDEDEVLVGTVGFLKLRGVEMPEGIRIHQAICLAVNGKMCGLFAVVYEKDKSRAAGLETLTCYRKLKTVIVTDDFTVSEGFIRERFGLKTKRILFPDREARAQLREKTADPEQPALALITGKGLAPFAYAVTGCRSLRKTTITGMIVHLIGGALGIGMMVALLILGATNEMTPARMFLYQLAMMIPGLLVTSWTRLI